MVITTSAPNAMAGPTYEEQVMSEMDDRWLSVDEISQYLGVSSDTVYRWIDKQGMPAHRMGRLWKFKKDEVDEWVKGGGAADRSKMNEQEE